MKRLTLIFLLAFVSLVQAQDLVDLTPGGFESGHPPGVFWKLFDPSVHFFDEAAQGWFDTPEGRRYFNEWVSLYGDLDGGVYFFTNLFALHNPRTARIWWNFIYAPQYSLGYIHVWGRKSTGVSWEHLYLVRHQFAGEGPVTLDGATGIQSIAFYGYER